MCIVKSQFYISMFSTISCNLKNLIFCALWVDHEPTCKSWCEYNLAQWMGYFLNPLDLFQISIRQRAQRKDLASGGQLRKEIWKVFGQTLCLLRSKGTSRNFLLMVGPGSNCLRFLLVQGSKLNKAVIYQQQLLVLFFALLLMWNSIQFWFNCCCCCCILASLISSS